MFGLMYIKKHLLALVHNPLVTVGLGACMAKGQRLEGSNRLILKCAPSTRKLEIVKWSILLQV
jgi:hypothetical protein